MFRLRKLKHFPTHPDGPSGLPAHLVVQVQPLKVAIENEALHVAVQGEVHILAESVHPDIMPVQVIEDAPGAHRSMTWPWLDGAAAWGAGGGSDHTSHLEHPKVPQPLAGKACTKPTLPGRVRMYRLPGPEPGVSLWLRVHWSSLSLFFSSQNLGAKALPVL